MAGSDLFDYMQAKDFNLGEERVREITFQLALGLKYLHKYGIVHRDLKLENVMMTDTTLKSVPKLVDFGLAKMIGPNEKADTSCLTNSRILTVFAISFLLFVLAELIGAILSNSLSLLGDAAAMSVDVFAVSYEK